MKDRLVYPVLLCGGSGSRLWPLSIESKPKQFLSIVGRESLFQQTIKRFKSLKKEGCRFQLPLIIAGSSHAAFIENQIEEIDEKYGVLITESIARNTAPALTLAVEYFEENNIDPILIVTPVDHYIKDVVEFQKVIVKGLNAAENNEVVLIGVEPERAEIGYGYIETFNSDNEHDLKRIKGFREKPDLSSALKYISDGNYKWNSGILIIKASLWRSLISKLSPKLGESVKNAWALKEYVGGQIVIDKLYENVDNISIDYAVLEKISMTNVISKLACLQTSWSDLGSWESVWNCSDKDVNGNVLIGETYQVLTNNSYAYSTSRSIGLVALDGVGVIETADAILVTKLDKSQNVKEIVNKLKMKENNNEKNRVHRPWGWFERLHNGDGYQVKKISVNPNSSISLQKHNFRSEHWVVIRGIAEITNGNIVKILHENESTFIPIGVVHRLNNPGTIPVEIIEVQTGSYLGEDDIIRLDDKYGRC